MNIDPAFIFQKIEAKTDRELLAYLADRLLEKGIVKEGFKEALIKRETDYPTGLPTEGAGTAIPHADPQYINENQVVIAVPAEPVPFKAMGSSDQEVEASVIFLLALREAHSHLEMLKELMELIQKPQALREIIAADSPEKVIQAIHGGKNHD